MIVEQTGPKVLDHSPSAGRTPTAGAAELTPAPSVLTVERLGNAEALESLGAAWDGLLSRGETRVAEMSHGWHVAYWRHLAARSELFVLVVRDAGEIVGIAPLKRVTVRALGVPVRHLQFIAADQSNYQDFLIRERQEEVLASIVRYLLEHRRGWDVLSLSHLPADSATARFFLEPPLRLAASISCSVASRLRCISLEVKETWEQFAGRTPRARSKITSRRRKLQKHGSLSWSHCSSEAEYESRLAQFVDLHRRRWRDTDTPSQFNDDRYVRFYLEAGRRLLPRKQIDLFMLEVGATPVSGLLTLQYDRRLVQQLTAYDPDPQYAPASPSLVMHELFVKELFDRQACVFDFGHYYPYKEAWADSYTSTVDLKIHHGSLIARYDHLAATLHGKLRARVRQHRALLQAGRRLRRLVRKARGRDREDAGT